MMIEFRSLNKCNETTAGLKRLVLSGRKEKMQHSLRIAAGLLLTAIPGWAGFPAMAASFHPGRPASPATRSSASVMAARANANANNAVGNPYVNPNVAAGGRSTQSNASANANAAEMRSAHQSVTTP